MRKSPGNNLLIAIVTLMGDSECLFPYKIIKHGQVGLGLSGVLIGSSIFLR